MYRRLLLLGDSQTQNGKWISKLNETFVRQLDTTNRGLSGYNTAWTVNSLQSILPNVPMYHYDMATVWFGCNDAVIPGHPQHVPLDQFKCNLERIVCRLTAEGVQPGNILVLTPPTLNEEMLDVKYPERIRLNTVTAQYAECVLKVGKERGCQTCDLFGMFGKAVEGGVQPFTDGLHLNEKGEEMVYRVVEEFVAARLDSKWAIPDWKDLEK